MARRPKKPKHEEHENHERWLVSYADLVTLLFAFFVIMYAVSRVDNNRLIQASNSIKWALSFEGSGGVGQLPLFQGPPSEGGCITQTGNKPYQTTPTQQRVVEAWRKRLEGRLRMLLTPRDREGAVTVVAEGGRLAIRMSTTRFFDPAMAAIRPDALIALDTIATELSAMGRPIRVEGHTDDRRITSDRYRNNWELSAARAASVVAYLQEVHAFQAGALTAEGHGDGRPVADNATELGREQNRRVELVIEVNDLPLAP